MKTSTFFISILLVISTACKKQDTERILFEDENLVIKKLTEHTFIHISYLDTQDFGKVACNGMIVIDENEAIVFDTPTNDAVSAELIHWIKENLKSDVKGVVITHYHTDCLGGLNEFHSQNIPSYANARTIVYAKQHNRPVPQIGFENKQELNVGSKKVINEFAGEGHTTDNIVAYFPSEKVLFGGCLIKAIGAGKGNLEDANTQEWSNTVQRVKEEFNDAKIVIPGHGKVGDKDLLEYTIDMFKGENINRSSKT